MKMSLTLFIIGCLCLLLAGAIGCKSMTANPTLSAAGQQAVLDALPVVADLGLAAAQAGVSASGVDPVTAAAINAALAAVAPSVEAAIAGLLKQPGAKDLKDVRLKAWTAESVKADVLAQATANLRSIPPVK